MLTMGSLLFRFANSISHKQAKYDPNMFAGMDDRSIAKAYETFFEGTLEWWGKNHSSAGMGLENLFSTACGQVVFVGPNAVQVKIIKKTRKNSRNKKKLVAFLHPVLKSKTYKRLVGNREIRQIFWQILLPGHTCFILFENGFARIVDNDQRTFGWNPDIIAAISKVLPWNQLRILRSPKEINAFTYSFDANIPNSCALITMLAIKHFIQKQRWESGIIELGITQVLRNKVTGRISTCAKKIPRKRQNFEELLREQNFDDMISKCFNWLVKEKIIGQKHFLHKKPDAPLLKANRLMMSWQSK